MGIDLRRSPATGVRAAVFVIVGLFVLSWAAAASAAPPAQQKDVASFGIGPGSAKGLDGRPYLQFYASPGATAPDHVVIRNLSTKPLTMAVYATNAESGADGTVSYTARTARPTGDAAWLSIQTRGSAGSVTVPARSDVVLPVTLKVPAHAAPGDHTIAVIASITSKVKSESGTNVDFEQRVALRAFIRVSGALNPSLEIQDVRVRYTASTLFTGRGNLVVHYRIRNAGNLNLGGRPQIEVNGPLGRSGSAGTLADTPVLLPGGSIEGNVVVRNVLAQGPMQARLTVSALKVPGNDDPTMAPMTVRASFFAVPWLLVIALGVLITVFLLWFWLRHRRGRNRSGPDGDPRPTSSGKHFANRRKGESPVRTGDSPVALELDVPEELAR